MIGGLLDSAISIGFALLLLGIVFATVRLVLGPSLADRVVALDYVTVILIAVAGLLYLRTGSAAYLDVAVTLALIGFLATVAFARYAERRAPGANQDRGEMARRRWLR